jgi:hypothetical protein
MTKLLETIFPRKKTRAEILREAFAALRPPITETTPTLQEQIEAFDAWRKQPCE